MGKPGVGRSTNQNFNFLGTAGYRVPRKFQKIALLTNKTKDFTQNHNCGTFMTRGIIYLETGIYCF